MSIDASVTVSFKARCFSDVIRTRRHLTETLRILRGDRSRLWCSCATGRMIFVKVELTVLSILVSVSNIQIWPEIFDVATFISEVSPVCYFLRAKFRLEVLDFV